MVAFSQIQLASGDLTSHFWSPRYTCTLWRHSPRLCLLGSQKISKEAKKENCTTLIAG